jgi:hypothetical protein
MCLHLQHKNVVDSSLSSFVDQKKREGGGGVRNKIIGTPNLSRLNWRKKERNTCQGLTKGTIKSNLEACELLHFLQMPDLLRGYYQNSFDSIPLQFLNQTTPQ